MPLELQRDKNHAGLMFTGLTEEAGLAVPANPFVTVDNGNAAPEIIASLEASIRLPARPGRRCVPRTPVIQMKTCASPYQPFAVSS